MAIYNWTIGEQLTASKFNTYIRDRSVSPVTSTTRPTSPVEGQIIYETDTERLYVYVPSEWIPLAVQTSRNLLLNGAMQVAQRNTSVTGITTGNYYTADRWRFTPSSGGVAGTWTNTVEAADAPTGSGYRKSLKFLCTTAQAAPAATTWLAIEQRIEGQDLQEVKKGTTSARTLTLQFWVKTNVVGTYAVSLFDLTNSRTVSATYTIAAGESGTWVFKTITFPADTTGAFANDNSAGLYLRMFLVAGSTPGTGTLPTTWGTTGTTGMASGQVNVAAAINNYWQITGAKLEVGAMPSAFIFESYQDELRKCLRYYYRAATYAGAGRVFATVWYSSATALQVDMPLPVPMMK